MSASPSLLLEGVRAVLTYKDLRRLVGLVRSDETKKLAKLLSMISFNARELDVETLLDSMGSRAARLLGEVYHDLQESLKSRNVHEYVSPGHLLYQMWGVVVVLSKQTG